MAEIIWIRINTPDEMKKRWWQNYYEMKRLEDVGRCWKCRESKVETVWTSIKKR